MRPIPFIGLDMECVYMRDQSKDFILKFFQNHTKPAKVLDVGSLDVNGSIKPLFDGCKYVGTDMREGPNVDVIVNAHELTTRFEKESFDLVVCLDTLEHDDRFWLTRDQLLEVLKPGGYLILGVPGRRCPEHDHPGDFWRFMPQSFPNFFFEGLEDFHYEVERQFADTEDEIYGWGRKPATERQYEE